MWNECALQLHAANIITYKITIIAYLFKSAQKSEDENTLAIFENRFF